MLSRSGSTVAALLLLAASAAPLPARQDSGRSTAQVATALERSTAQVEKSYEPSIPAPTPLEPPADGQSKVEPGKVSAAKPVLYSMTMAATRMIEIRVSSPANVAALSIYREDAKEAASGTRIENHSIGFISTVRAGEKLRVLVWTTHQEETPFRLLVRIHPKTED